MPPAGALRALDGRGRRTPRTARPRARVRDQLRLGTASTQRTICLGRRQPPTLASPRLGGRTTTVLGIALPFRTAVRRNPIPTPGGSTAIPPWAAARTGSPIHIPSLQRSCISSIGTAIRYCTSAMRTAISKTSRSEHWRTSLQVTRHGPVSSSAIEIQELAHWERFTTEVRTKALPVTERAKAHFLAATTHFQALMSRSGWPALMAFATVKTRFTVYALSTLRPATGCLLISTLAKLRTRQASDHLLTI